MNDLEYRTRLAVIRTSIGSEEYFEDFINIGVNGAREIITGSLEKNSSGLSYIQLEMLVEAGLENTSIRDLNNAWKIDAFILALAELELEDKKIKMKEGVFLLV